MEHLLLNPNGQASFRIQYHGGCGGLPYDGRGFDDYLARHRYSEDKLVDGSQFPMADAKHRHFLCLLQNYTFFALLHEFLQEFGTPFNIQEFSTKDEAGITWVTTATLPDLTRQIALRTAALVIEAHEKSNSLFRKDALADAPDSLLVMLSRMSSPNLDFAIRIRRLRAVFHTVKSFLSRVTTSLSKRRELLLFRDEDYKTVVASQILILTLENFLQSIFGSSGEDVLDVNVDMSAFGAHMREKHWCPNRTSGLMPLLYLAVFMMELDSGTDRLHGAALSAAVQKLHCGGRDDRTARMETLKKLILDDGPDGIPPCTDTKCLRSIVDNQNVRPSHRCSTEAICEDLSINQELLCSTYSGSGFPLIRFNSVDQPLRLEKHKNIPGFEFCAISHVWSHGLGNPFANSLPKCQISFIARLVEKVIPESCYFWIDTLCVPVSPDHKEVRKTAVAKMAHIYKSATYTIVLDKFLQQVSDNPYEMGLQLLCSEWGRRLWTLQEAVLPGSERLLILFKSQMVFWDSVCSTGLQERQRILDWVSKRFQDHESLCLEETKLSDLNTLERRVMEIIDGANSRSSRIIPPLQIWNPMERAIRFQLDEMLNLGVSRGIKQLDSLLRVAMALCRRSTTKWSDEFICVGHLLGMEFSHLDHPPSSLDVILERVPVPEDLIFIPGPRIPIKGFRWAPASLLGSGVVSLLATKQKPAKIDGNGITIEKASLVSLNDVRFQKDTTYTLRQDGKSIADVLAPICTVDFVRPVFILLYDFPNVWARRSTVKAIVVDAEVDQKDLHGKYATYLFDVTMARIEVSESVPHSHNRLQTINVRYHQMGKWTID